MLNRVKNALNEEEWDIFVQSFVGYLKYDQEKDFVVDLDAVYSWMYTRKDTAKDKLVSNYEENTDFLIKKPTPTDGNELSKE